MSLWEDVRGGRQISSTQQDVLLGIASGVLLAASTTRIAFICCPSDVTQYRISSGTAATASRGIIILPEANTTTINFFHARDFGISWIRAEIQAIAGAASTVRIWEFTVDADI